MSLYLGWFLCFLMCEPRFIWRRMNITTDTSTVVYGRAVGIMLRKCIDAPDEDGHIWFLIDCRYAFTYCICSRYLNSMRIWSYGAMTFMHWSIKFCSQTRTANVDIVHMDEPNMDRETG